MRYLTLAEAFAIAEAVSGIDAVELSRVARLELLDSALHAPQAVSTMLKIAAGEFDEPAVAAWLSDHLDTGTP